MTTELQQLGQMLKRIATRGLLLAQYVHEVGTVGLELDRPTTRLYNSIARAFFGPCKVKGIRHRVKELSAEFSITRIAIIHKAVGQLNRRAPMDPWQLRLELTERTDLNLDELAQHAKARVRELNAAGGMTPRRSLVIGQHTDATGRRTATLKLPEEEMRDIEKRVRKMVSTRGRVPEDVAMGNAMWTLLTTGAAVGGQAIEPVVLIKADDLVGDGNGRLICTDGTTMDEESYLNSQLARYGWVMVYDRNAQPVNLWRTERFANDKQRLMLAIDQGQCAWPGCTRTAEHGKAHHVTPWAAGGNTNIDNLMGLCGPHNALNDDDPARRRNGRMQFDEAGRPCHHPPDGGPPRYNNGYHTAQSGRVWALS